MLGVLWFVASDDERRLDFPEELFRYVREDGSMVIRSSEGRLVKKSLNWRYLGGEVAMKVIEEGRFGEVSGLVFGCEDPTGVASHFLAGVPEGRLEGNRGDKESMVGEGEEGLVSVN